MNWEEKKIRLLVILVLIQKRTNKIMLYLGIIFNLVLLYMMVFVDFNITAIIFIVNTYNIIMLYVKYRKEKEKVDSVII